jgi:hypothetical protein
MKKPILADLTVIVFILACGFFTSDLAAQTATLKNDTFSISFDAVKGTWNFSTAGGEAFLKNAAFRIISENGGKYVSTSPLYKRKVYAVSREKLEIEFIPQNNSLPEARLSFELPAEQNYFALDVIVKNSTPAPLTIREIQVITTAGKQNGALHFRGLARQISCLIDGYSPGDEAKLLHLNDTGDLSGYTSAALYNHISKRSMIVGALNNRQAIPLIALHRLAGNDKVTTSFDLTFSSYFVSSPLPPGGSLSGGRLMISLPENVFDGLEQYAALLAETNHITLDKKPLSGWCSWYYVYADITEKEVLLNLNFLKENLKDYGLDYIQVDRGRIVTGSDWLTTNSKFPHGMPWLAARIHDAGFKAGIWTAPYWLGRDSKAYRPQWILEKISPQPIQEGGRRRHWASWGDVLDTSNEDVTDYMRNFVDTLTSAWHYDYLKNDFLQYGFPEIKKAAGTLLEKGEVSGLKKFPRKNTDITPIEAFQNGLQAIRSAAGENTFIMGCGAPLFHAGGFVDAARVGGDIQSKLCVTWQCGTSKTVRTSAKRYYYNGRTLWIDPDCLVIWDPCGRGPFTLNQARVRAALAALFGGMLMMSDRMYDLPPERVDLLRKVTPVWPHSARPLDLFEKDMPEIWLWDIKKDFERWQVLGVFNYTDTTTVREISYDYLGLDTTKQYIFYDFWAGKMPTRSSRYYFRSLMPFAREMALEIAPNACKIIAIHEKLPHPQVLSTNRHLSQGAVDLESVVWNADSGTLSGVSKLVKNDDYELVVTLPEDLAFVSASAKEEGVSCSAWLDDPDVDRYNTVRIQLKSEKNQNAAWSVRFK